MTLSIIILSHNTRELLKQTIDSIQVQKDWEIIVVDNASSDGSAEMIRDKYPRVKLLINDENIGFAAANNQGIKESRAKYVMLLNSDTQILDDAIEKMLGVMESNPQIGMITPKVVLPDGAIDLACHRGMPTPWRALTYFSKLEQLFPESSLFGGYHLTHLDFDQTHQIEATAATAIIVRRKAIDQVGLLDERFFLYAEDLDWCKRFTDASWEIVYYPDSVVLHHKSQSGKNNIVDREKQRESSHHFYDTMKQFYDKHYDDKYPWPLKKIIYSAIDIKKYFS